MYTDNNTNTLNKIIKQWTLKQNNHPLLKAHLPNLQITNMNFSPMTLQA